MDIRGSNIGDTPLLWEPARDKAVLKGAAFAWRNLSSQCFRERGVGRSLVLFEAIEKDES